MPFFNIVRGTKYFLILFGGFTIGLIPGLTGCKSNRNPMIPSVPVNVVLNLGNPQFSALNVPGGYVVLPDEGSRGIIVVRVNVDDVAAFDLHCPQDVNNPCGKAQPDPNGLKLVCPCCTSEWNILSGQTIKGPSVWPLFNYRTSFDGMVVRVFN